MTDFALPADLAYNRGLIDDPRAYARERGVQSWLFLVGDEFAATPGGMSWAQVQESVHTSARVVSDPPRELTLDLARQHVAALDALPRRRWCRAARGRVARPSPISTRDCGRVRHTRKCCRRRSATRRHSVRRRK